MVFPASPADVVTELYVNSGWTDVSTKVYQRDKITVERGRLNGRSGPASPSRCTLTFNNRTGDFSPRNPAGAYYGSLGQNTPLRIGIRTAKDAVGRITSNGWGTADLGGVWSTFSGSAGDYATGSGVATHTISSTSSLRLSYLGGQLYRDADISATVSLPFSNVTGGSVEPLNLVVGGASTSDYFMLSLKITSAEVITMRLNHVDGTDVVSTFNLALAYTGQALRARLQMEGQTLRAKVWNASGAEPFAWDAEGSTAYDAYINRAAGWCGIRSGVSTGNTNTPVVFSYDNIEIKCNRFHGEIASWPAGWDTSGNDIYTKIEAAGLRRRLSQGAKPLRSTFYRGVVSYDPANLVGYWPAEDSSGSSGIASGLPGGKPMIILGSPTYAADSTSFVGSAPIPKVNGSSWEGRVVGAPSTGNVGAMFLLSIPAAGETNDDAIFRINTTGTAAFFDLTYATGGEVYLRCFDRSRAIIATSSTTTGLGLNGVPMLVTIGLSQSGADIAYDVTFFIPDLGYWDVLNGTFSGRTVGTLLGVMASQYRQMGSNTAIGHISAWTTDPFALSLADQLAAYPGEYAASRVARLCYESDDIPNTFIRGLPPLISQMGTQGRKTLLQLIDEAVAADLAVLKESRNVTGFVLRYGNSLYNQVTALSLNYSTGQIQPPFSPVDDDQLINNDVTISRTDGSSAQATQTTGPLAVTSPSSGVGVGRYDTETELNLYSDDHLADIAAWVLHVGVNDESRYPRVEVNVAKLATISQQLMLDALCVDLDDRIEIINPKNPIVYDTISQLTTGYTEEFGGKEHTIAFSCLPAAPYGVVRLNSSTMAKLDSGTSTLASGYSSSATSLSVTTSNSQDLWKTGSVSIPITVAGEAMTVTNVSGASSPQTFTVTRSVNGVVKAQSSGAQVHTTRRATLAL